jgi:hypothetical protein
MMVRAAGRPPRRISTPRAAVDCIADWGRSASMSREGPRETDSRDPGAQRWGAEKEQIDKGAAHDHLAHEAERIHAEEAAEMAAERGEAPKPKRPWWKFWG